LALSACATTAPVTTANPASPIEIERATLAIDVTREPYKPKLPPTLDAPGMVVWGVFRVCAAADGQVFDVGIVTSADPQVDDAWIKTLRTWRYQPYTLDGKATAFCVKERVKVESVAPGGSVPARP
jgi:hypothetical protein